MLIFAASLSVEEGMAFTSDSLLLPATVLTLDITSPYLASLSKPSEA